jgi:hypothetical protein
VGAGRLNLSPPLTGVGPLLVGVEVLMLKFCEGFAVGLVGFELLTGVNIVLQSQMTQSSG